MFSSSFLVCSSDADLGAFSAHNSDPTTVVASAQNAFASSVTNSSVVASSDANGGSALTENILTASASRNSAFSDSDQQLLASVGRLEAFSCATGYLPLSSSAYDGGGGNYRKTSSSRISHIMQGKNTAREESSVYRYRDKYSRSNGEDSSVGNGNFSMSGSSARHLMSFGVSGTTGIHDCHVCLKHFQSRADVVRHMRTHTGERPFKCPHCDYSAALKGNLKSHILSRHPDAPASRIMLTLWLLAMQFFVLFNP
ncbi:hypothetical protein HAZT_HAZT009619 [Hyalella azteca]|uniref:C2H2-type domain-containing protein n=1 Tax=Hyalella azteca TaxID=294128 RepID=A0A6A0HFL4_HYAAZ|nr:hypothetical protein HAZT_HAZT009619 [Hyalella azteca]